MASENKTYDIPLHSVEYSSDIAGNLSKALSPKFSQGKPHALSCNIWDGNQPRIDDFMSWKKIGIGSHSTVTLAGEPPEVRDPLCIAAFLLTGSDFMNALPREEFKLPRYLFLTHSLVVWETSKIGKWHSGNNLDPSKYVFVAQTHGPSAHSALSAKAQIEKVIETVFFRGEDVKPLFRVRGQATKEKSTR
jgi:hypothetical protein